MTTQTLPFENAEFLHITECRRRLDDVLRQSRLSQMARFDMCSAFLEVVGNRIEHQQGDDPLVCTASEVQLGGRYGVKLDIRGIDYVEPGEMPYVSGIAGECPEGGFGLAMISVYVDQYVPLIGEQGISLLKLC